MPLAADPTDVWGMLVTLFALFGWLGFATVAMLLALAIRSFVRAKDRVRVCDATLFAMDHPVTVAHEPAEPGLP